MLKEECGGGSSAKEVPAARVLALLLEFRRVYPKQPDAGSPDTAISLALAIHHQRVAVRYARRAGYIGMGGGGEQRHQGGGGGEGNNQDNGKAPAHGVMLPPRQEQTKMCW